MQRPGGGRVNSAQRQKHQLVGHNATRVPPAWKPSKIPGAFPSAGPSSRVAGFGATRTPLNAVTPSVEAKILISGLPNDVKPAEIEDLMKKTVGPVKDAFMIFNSQGASKGMAIVTFHRTSDALQAREKYHQKVIDGRRAIKIEFIVDSDTIRPPPAAPAIPKPKSLFDRLGVQSGTSSQQASAGMSGGVKLSNGGLNVTPRQPTAPGAGHFSPHPHQKFQPRQPKPIKSVSFAAQKPITIPVFTPIQPRKARQKKGPKRVTKRQAMSVADLDAEMDEYNALKGEDVEVANDGLGNGVGMSAEAL